MGIVCAMKNERMHSFPVKTFPVTTDVLFLGSGRVGGSKNGEGRKQMNLGHDEYPCLCLTCIRGIECNLLKS